MQYSMDNRDWLPNGHYMGTDGGGKSNYFTVVLASYMGNNNPANNMALAYVSGSVTRSSLNKFFSCPSDPRTVTNDSASVTKYPVATNIAMTTANLEVGSNTPPAANTVNADRFGRWGGSTAGVPETYDTRKRLSSVISGSVIFTEAYAYMLSNTGLFADYSREGAYFPNANINPFVSTPGREAIWGYGNYYSSPKNRAHFLHSGGCAFAFADGHVSVYRKGTKFDKHWCLE